MLRKIIFALSFLIIIAALVFKIVKDLSSAPRFNIQQAKDIKIIGLDSIKDDVKTSEKNLKVLSANLIAEFEPIPQSSSSSMKIKSLRILGEVKNTGKIFAEDPTPLITFYDQENQKIAVKVASFSDEYFFPKLRSGEKYFYDIFIKDLPNDFQNLNIFFKPSSKTKSSSPLISQHLKIEDRSLEENIATASATQTEKYYYYRLKGKITNTGEKQIKNVQIFAYALDKDNRVFAWINESFPSDLFSKDNKHDVNLLVTPLKNEKAEKFEVFLFGEEL